MNNSVNVFPDGENLSLKDVVGVARQNKIVALLPENREKMEKSRSMLDKWIEEEKIVYGITTGFGPFVSTLIPTRYQTDLQENLIRSHAANVGPNFSDEEVRAAMLLRTNAFAKGFSAIRLETVDLLISFLNAGIQPVVPEWGSVGASGDLTPSAHIALSLMGEGLVRYKGEIVPTSEALKATGLKPVKFKAKEGLALINGTTMMTGVGALMLSDAWTLLRTAEIISALGIEALLGSSEPFLAEGHLAKAHPGQIATAANLRELLQGSSLVWDPKQLSDIQKELQEKMKTAGDVVDSGIHVQNVYSLRATPQILGAVRDALTYATERITTEMNSANDNPLFFPELGISYQGANFHGQSVALPLDVAAIATTEIGVLSERRLNKLLDPARNHGLSPFLARGKSGLRCGLEGAQYIATSLVAECRTMCAPASIQSIPSNGENQDVVSMGLVAARKARDIKNKISAILAVELLAATEALEERDLSKLSPIGETVRSLVRGVVAPYNNDVQMNPLITAVQKLIVSGEVVEVVEKKIGHSMS
ncbi:MAG: tyrosine 2,3-aminomutase [Candidatus Magasanikbacteria bacterium]|nr:tyrosine 2,3-aminomutase [Candidatus Magasanikbacteria bacterium]